MIYSNYQPRGGSNMETQMFVLPITILAILIFVLIVLAAICGNLGHDNTLKKNRSQKNLNHTNPESESQIPEPRYNRNNSGHCRPTMRTQFRAYTKEELDRR